MNKVYLKLNMKKHPGLALLVGTAFTAAMALTAQADPTLRSLTVGAQSPSVANPGGQAYFPVAITRTGLGSMSVFMSVTGLPQGTTSSFVPPDLSFSDQSPSTKNAKLLIRVAPGTPPGTYQFVVNAQKGNSRNTVSSTNALVVGTVPIVIQQPVLSTPTPQSNGTVLLGGSGTANQPVVIEATTDLSTGIWTPIEIGSADATGVFSIIDQDASLYPMRFYRASQ